MLQNLKSIKVQYVSTNQSEHDAHSANQVVSRTWLFPRLALVARFDSSSDWFIMQFVAAVIGFFYFGVSFYRTAIEKLLCTRFPTFATGCTLWDWRGGAFWREERNYNKLSWARHFTLTVPLST